MDTDHTLGVECPILACFCQAPAVGTNISRAKIESATKYDSRLTVSSLPYAPSKPLVVIRIAWCIGFENLNKLGIEGLRIEVELPIQLILGNSGRKRAGALEKEPRPIVVRYAVAQQS